MKITLLITTFNSISQLIYVKLKDLGYLVDIVYAINDEQMIKEVEEFKPDIILCPFLKKYVPKEIFNSYPTFIFHPGPLGDKGANSLDLAIKNWYEYIISTINDYSWSADKQDIYTFIQILDKKDRILPKQRIEINIDKLVLANRIFMNKNDFIISNVISLKNLNYLSVWLSFKDFWQYSNINSLLSKFNWNINELINFIIEKLNAGSLRLNKIISNQNLVANKIDKNTIILDYNVNENKIKRYWLENKDKIIDVLTLDWINKLKNLIFN